MALSFRTRLALWSALLAGIVMLVFYGVTAWMVFDNMLEEADQELRVMTKLRALEAAEKKDLRSDYYATLSAEDADVWLLELTEVSHRKEFEKNHAPPIDWPDPKEPPNYTPNGSGVTRSIDGKLWREMSRKVQVEMLQDGATYLIRYHIRMAIDLQEIRDEVVSMVKRYLRALPFALIFIGLSSWWVAGRAVKPIQKIIATAEHITPEGLRERIVGVESADELGRLARVLNSMMDRLEGAFRQQRRFSSDASHELRTPLTVMQGKIEAALQKPGSRPEDNATLVELLERVGQLRSIIDSLLLLSRSDAGSLVPDRGELSLAELLVDVLEDAEILADEAGLEIEADVATASAKVSGDGRLLRLAISNLLTNAVKYNTPGGKVRCNLNELDGGYAVVVRNTGPAINGVECEKIFERFYRADPARGAAKQGFGLGLSLSQVIAHAHGGRLSFEGSKDGWNTFVLRLPRATVTSGKVEEREAVGQKRADRRIAEAGS